MIADGPAGDRSLSVSDVNQRVKQLLTGDPTLSHVTVRGEISNWRPYSSGHCYFTLKDAGGELSAVMFRSAAQRLRFQPSDGMAVKAAGRVDVYEKRGEYQLYVEAMAHDGAGALFEAFERLKARLAGEGLFDPERRKPLPVIPKRVAVITSPTGAAVRDMLSILRTRWPAVKVLLIPAVVQGQEAAPSLVRALDQANRVGGVDVILFGRGGGSIEDLWAFNEEPVARAVAASRVPVISCVGHETDVTICDFVADARAATPSHAAQLAVPDVAEVRAGLDGLGRRLAGTLSRQLQAARSRFALVAARRVLASPEMLLDSRRQSVDELSARLGRSAVGRLAHAATRLDGLSKTLDALDPTRVLGRGYAIVLRRNDDRVVQCPNDLPPGAQAEIRLATGRLAVTSDGELT
ncbi:MAG: exodeoxyribonuclease VII large subunit [Armatimonadetes bacterium]|nr:exodeoxyribonuclease VII large subunit [Armatimonadota bacterium]